MRILLALEALEDCKAIKRALGRDKDMDDLELIRARG